MTIFAIIGEAGTGKDYFLRKVVDTYPQLFHEIISCTTRPPREGEIHGKNYYFLKEKDFIQKINNHSMLEHTSFREWYYGTSLDSLSQDKINIGVFNPAGIYNLLQHHQDINLKVFRLKVTDKERIKRQLNREENPNIHEICRRFLTDEEDFRNLQFNYEVLMNERLDDLFYNASYLADLAKIC